jgi:hypothetical protein
MRSLPARSMGYYYVAVGILMIIIAVIGLTACKPDPGRAQCVPSATQKCAHPTPNPTP